MTSGPIRSSVFSLANVLDASLNDHFAPSCSGTFVNLTGVAPSLFLTAGHCPLEIGQRLIETTFDTDNVLLGWETVGFVSNFSSKRIEYPQSAALVDIALAHINVTGTMTVTAATVGFGVFPAVGSLHTLAGYGIAACRHILGTEDPLACNETDAPAEDSVTVTGNWHPLVISGHFPALGQGKLRQALPRNETKEELEGVPLHLTNHAEAGKEEIEGGDRLIAPYEIPPKLTKKR